MSDSSINIVQKLIRNFWNEERDAQVRALSNAPLLRPLEYVYNNVIPEVVMSSLLCTVVYLLAFLVVDSILPKSSSSSSNKEENIKSSSNQEENIKTLLIKRRKGCYQIVHIFANLLLGCAGMYYNSRLNPDPTPKELVQMVEGYSFGTFQLGYQLWAIPVGILIQEDILMLVHHVAVIMAASTMVFFTNGMRYWSPFLLGTVEISSVPLVIMNIMRGNEALKQQYPQFFFIIQTTFAITFLYVRVWMFVPRNCAQMYDHVTAWLASNDRLYQFYCFVVFSASLFLTFLQLKWGAMILERFVVAYLGIVGKRNENEKKD